MKIGIDGFNLGMRQGTGIATYGRELAKLLVAAGHDVQTLFGLQKAEAKQQDLAWPHFVQQLITVGESGRHEFRHWGGRAAQYGMQHLLRRSIVPTKIERNIEVDVSAVAEKLPAGSSYFNSPSLFRASQALSFISSRPLSVKMPPGSKLDLFHFTCPLPIKVEGVPNIVTAHDAIPLVVPQTTAVNLKHYKHMTRTAFAAADKIITVSDHSRRDIIAHYQVPEEKLVTLHQAVDIPARYRELDPESVGRFLLRNYGLRSGQYVLFYGAFEPKKNLARLIDAFSLLKTNTTLVLVGRDAWLNDDVEKKLKELKELKFLKAAQSLPPQPGVSGDVLRLEYVPFANLMYLLKGARALVFPSLYEGFGLPVLEAMLMGVPVITSKTSSLPEVGGDAALYVDPLSLNDIASAIDKIVSDDEFHAHSAAAGLRQAEKFSPAVHLQKLEKVYAEVLCS